MEKQQNNTPAVAQNAVKETASARFTKMVMDRYGDIAGRGHQFTSYEKRLITNYFVCIDQALSKAEAERVRKNATNRDHERYDNNLAYSWQNVDLPTLAQDLAHYAHIGLDMMADNHLFPIPYKNNKGNQYAITLMPGYNGIRYEAEKYALNPPKNVTVEVVYSTDVFKPIKKDRTHDFESYEFEIANPFDRGQIVGVFGYIEFDDPAKNKLIVFSKADVEKRKPKYASPEFWGGKKPVYENGKKTGEIEVEGWQHEMYEKTMKREIFGSKHIPRDPSKIDESYQYAMRREQEYADMAIETEFTDNANKTPVSLPEQPKPLQAAGGPPPADPVADDIPADPDF